MRATPRRGALGLGLSLALASACVRFEGMPDMPPGMASDPSVYASSKGKYNDAVALARFAVRSKNLSWTLTGTAGERFAGADELRRRFGGVIFVGDSQIREVAWAALQMLTPNQKLGFSRSDPVFGGSRGGAKLGTACVPQSVGKTGFTAACDAASGSTAGDCALHSPFKNKTHAEKMRTLLLTRPHDWNGQLSVSSAVCESDFFVAYQATWGAMPIDPTSLPSCLHPEPGGDGSYVLRHKRLGVQKPVLWVIDGCGLHEMEFCDARRWELPQYALPKFSPSLLKSVVYQTVGAGFLMKGARRFKGECAAVNADQVAAKESAWLSAHGVRHYNYTGFALQHAPLMFDAIHFTYYWVPCSHTFPEMSRLVAQLALQHAVGRPVEYCAAGTPASTPRVVGDTSVGLSSISLAQSSKDSALAYELAFVRAPANLEGELKATYERAVAQNPALLPKSKAKPMKAKPNPRAKAKAKAKKG